jgi:hypothetical protein
MAAEAKALFEQGVRAFRANDKAQARQLIKESLALAPDNDMAWLMYARLQDDDDKRLKCVERALKINPSNPTALEMKRRLAEKTPVQEGVKPFQTTTPAKVVRDTPAIRKTQPAIQPPEASSPTGKVIEKVGLRWMYQVRKIIGLCAFGLLSAMYIPSILRHPELMEDFGSVFLMVTIPLGALLCLFTLIITPLGKPITIYEDGIRCGNSHWRWNELDGVVKIWQLELSIRRFIGMLSPFYDMGFYRLNIYYRGKVVAAVTRDYDDFYNIGEAILQHSKTGIVERYLNEWRDKKELTFDGLKLDQAGISGADFSFSWQDIHDAEAYGKRITLRTLRSPRHIEVPRPLNSHILAGIVMSIITISR